MKKEQLFKIFNEAGRELAVNSLISEGWRVVSFCSSDSHVLTLSILFEREVEE